MSGTTLISRTNPRYWNRELQWRLQWKALASIDLLVMDVDGVLTDGGLWLDAHGELQKRFDVRDGLGLRLLQQEGLILALLSGGKGGATDARAKQLGIQHCLVGIKDKTAALSELQQQLNLAPAQTAFVGDDLNDLIVRPLVKLLLAPADACRPLRSQADAVLQRPGGHGAVRELAERLLKARDRWDQLRKNGWRDRND
ncbi:MULTISPECIES: KdsC family phosphatase [unclassified Prochlorococcus]|uniref:KdsC family phosphatase n=1 Tax=unclassified Prochlorococcus TaxID=2627481 RepID=UPI000533988F|nr:MULTISPECIES: HAD family hydrolase [unclassified Prochlorococcus]KGG26645.1 3-deoxy-D-manno-octulosonate 8-phosphate phosphatasee [Prochlorococcus sp. MIT 0701]KGG30200.1 3-deoxy-D-manno-octulosonate 8-phosphate phosphatasee [Prochlorococcus sp. MIT 0702]KGG34981.1 3-deoxy-D-manno-octulosonate 8-phosphate phosphatasee [Prochlorococcus sp. MIT 0703]